LQEFAEAMARMEERLIELSNAVITRGVTNAGDDPTLMWQLPINTLAEFDSIEDMLKDVVLANALVCMPCT